MISVVVISKDEPFLEATLDALEVHKAVLAAQGHPVEVLVVDASSGRLSEIQRAHPEARWIDFEAPRGVAVSIPHQRNAGVRAATGDTVVFTDAGCVPLPGWLEELTRLTRSKHEHVVVGATRSKHASFKLYDARSRSTGSPVYLHECATINLAVVREVFDTVGGFDESFRYGSDVDFSWRVVDAGYRLRSAPEAVVEVDWGSWRRQLRRSYLYGRARVMLYRKHPDRLRGIVRHDPIVVAWPVFVLGLPIAIWHPEYLLLLLIPAWNNRRIGAARAILDHLAYAVGTLSELAGV